MHMSTTTSSSARTAIPPKFGNAEEWHHGLGDVPLSRIVFDPWPGTATEQDLLTFVERDKRLVELVDGTLVEKPMGYYESLLAGVLIQLLRNFLDAHDLGIVLAADDPLRLASGLVRIPDVCFISWERFPNRELPAEPIPELAPDLAVEVLSESNTEAEMERKLREYFAAGTRVVWYVEPEPRTVRVYTSPSDVRLVGEAETLDGGTVLPGFQLKVREWFDRAGRRRSR